MELPNYAQTSQEVVSYVCWKYMFAENMAMCFAKWAPHRHSVRQRSRSAQNASVHRPRDGCLGADELQGPVQRLTLRGGREHRGTVAAARQFLSKLAFSVPGPEPRLYPAACDRCGVQQAKARTSRPAGLGTGSFAARGRKGFRCIIGETHTAMYVTTSTLHLDAHHIEDTGAKDFGAALEKLTRLTRWPSPDYLDSTV